MKILFIGAIRRNGYATVKHLRELGLECDIVLPKDHIPNVFYQNQMNDIPSWVKIMDDRPRSIFLKIMRKLKTNLRFNSYDFIHSRCLGALFFFKPGIPYVEQSVGSDMRELAVQSGGSGKRIIRHYRNAKKVIISQTDHIRICKRLNLRNYVYIPLLADSKNYFPDRSTIDFGNYDLTIFHPAHLDWTYTYGDRSAEKGNNKKYRSSTKGNDRLIKAFCKLVKSGCKALLIMLERGIDVKETKELITDLGITKHVIWRKEMDNLMLRQYFSSVDVVADQFDCGSLGLIAYGAMLCGAPVIGFLDEESAKLCYEELPPIINCHSEDQLYCSLTNMKSQDLKEIGTNSRKWVLKHHSAGYVCGQLKKVYEGI